MVVPTQNTRAVCGYICMLGLLPYAIAVIIPRVLTFIIKRTLSYILFGVHVLYIFVFLLFCLLTVVKHWTVQKL